MVEPILDTEKWPNEWKMRRKSGTKRVKEGARNAKLRKYVPMYVMAKKEVKKENGKNVKGRKGKEGRGRGGKTHKMRVISFIRE